MSYLCHVLGCPGNHPSKWMCCTQPAPTPSGADAVPSVGGANSEGQTEVRPTLRERAIAARKRHGDDRDAGVNLVRLPVALFDELVAVEDQDAVHWRTRRALLATIAELKLSLQSERDENFTLNLTCAQLGDEKEAALATIATLTRERDDLLSRLKADNARAQSWKDYHAIESLRKELFQARREVEGLREALNDLCRAYVQMLESAREQIISHGGDCDPVAVMERADPRLTKARAALAQSGDKPSKEQQP